MEKNPKTHKLHCLILAYPTQGHLNPILEFSKRLNYHKIKTTLVTTKFFANSLQKKSQSIPIETISDGYDSTMPTAEEQIKIYLEKFRVFGFKSLVHLIEKKLDVALSCIIYDAFLPWGLDVARKFGLIGCAFFTQSCAVDNIYLHIFKGLEKIPSSLENRDMIIPGLGKLDPHDFPSFVYDVESYPSVFELLVNQISNVDKADWILCNSFYELEQEEVDWLKTQWPKLRTIGPTIPSMFLDKRIEDDTNYGFNMFTPKTNICIQWLNLKPKGSVVYISFGSMASLTLDQMEELCWGLIRSNYYYLWVVRATEEANLPENLAAMMKSGKGMVVEWCSQLEVLGHESVGCFVTHCGWNSCLESLSMGIPMVGMPQWSDQSSNAKYVSDVWKVGIRGKVDEEMGIVKRGEVEFCVREVMEGEMGKEMKRNALKWKEIARKCVDEGGSSDRNIGEFVTHLFQF